ncbi:hypothetical protein [Hydrogenophaga sp. R2]|uniref:hypothetical protein n=1 Tax=Hydrogenophaga sp. R2 TaxID=3132827 RepID=UPI003CF640D6
MNQPTPAIVTQAAVRRLPRWALLLFCAAYVLPGFLGREPWKLADVAAFGAMLEMATGIGQWLQPAVLGQPLADPALLPYWLGAAAIRALPFLEPALAARLPFIGLLGVTLAATWYTVYHLARQPAALPVAFAFGGEAHPTDYARALADAGLLALVACLGLAQLSHETTPDLVRLTGVALLLLGAARLLSPDAPRPWRSLLIWAAGCAVLALSDAVLPLAALGLVWMLTLSTRRSHPGWMAGLIWLLALALGEWLSGGLAPSSWTPRTDDADSFARLLLWFTWPAWPLALWTLWRWRRQWLAPHVALPLWLVAVGVLTSALADERDRALLTALPGLAALAAFALPTLKRSVSALIDWFTLLFFSGCALIIWVIWVAMMTGVPAKPAANVAKLAPGFVPEFAFLPFLLGLLATLAWVWLVSWRVGRHRQALWKSLVLPSAGAILCWLLLMTLWLPLLDFGRSYGPLSRRIATLVPPGSCVMADGLNAGQITALRYHGGLTVVPSVSPGEARCRVMVVSPASQPTLDQRVALTDWAYQAAVSRLGDSKETLLVYRRIGR